MNAARPLVASKLLPRLRTCGLLVLVAGTAAAFAAPPARLSVPVKLPPPTWPWRQVMRENTEPRPAATPAAGVQAVPPRERLSPLLLRAEPDTSDLVTLPALRVNGSRLAQEVKREYAIARQRAQDEAVLRRVGTGMHQVGHSHFGILTVFYIPVFAGFGWSW